MTSFSPPAEGCAWVTGASTGIGRELAIRLASLGWTVAITARRKEILDELATQYPKLKAFACDVTDATAMAATAAQIEAQCGPIALAILNAGTYQHESVATLNAADFTKVISTNVLGVVHGLVPVLASMRARRSGQIAMVSSVAGYTGLGGSLAYGASKAALINLAQALAAELHGQGIKLQVICPGFVATPLTAQNTFPMPFLITAEQAVDRIINGLASNGFEISFPKRMVWLLKVLRCLPYGVYLPLVARTTVRR
jgi:short-subunit dehydrogenase